MPSKHSKLQQTPTNSSSKDLTQAFPGYQHNGNISNTEKEFGNSSKSSMKNSSKLKASTSQISEKLDKNFTNSITKPNLPSTHITGTSKEPENSTRENFDFTCNLGEKVMIKYSPKEKLASNVEYPSNMLEMEEDDVASQQTPQEERNASKSIQIRNTEMEKSPKNNDLPSRKSQIQNSRHTAHPLVFLKMLSKLLL